MTTKYYRITHNDMIPITYQEYQTLPQKDRHLQVFPSNTLKDNLKKEWNHQGAP